METFAVDFETYYDNEISVTIQGAPNYAALAHIYLVSIYSPTLEYVGCVEDAPWGRISGNRWVSHNAGFDSAVFAAAVEKGQIPLICLEDWDGEFSVHGDPAPSAWDCTADLSAYFGIGRSLKDAVKTKYGIDISKNVRANAKGKVWPSDFKPEEQDAMEKYALEDARHCWNLWNDLGASWPVKEIELSRITRKRCQEGICISSWGIIGAKSKLERVMAEAKAAIPWSSEGVILSHKKVREYCAAHAIPAPASLAEDSPECEVWEAEYGKRHRVVGEIRTYRKANIMNTKLQSMWHRTMPNGRMAFGLKYYGAHTGRFSGADGLNMQNLPKEELFGVDMRSLFIAAPGKKFIICDLAQIEPRCTAWLVKDTVMLQSMREGFGIYEAFAKSTGVWDGEAGTMKGTHKDLYALCKAQVLALGYGCGPKKFILMAKLYAGLDIDIERSAAIVGDFREKNWRIVNFWSRLFRELQDSYNDQSDHEIELPSGRLLRYSNIQRLGVAEGRGLMARQGYTGFGKKMWGGQLFENVIQAIARDVLVEGILRLEAAGIPVVFSAHDEVICEVAESFEGSFIKLMMTEPPAWMPDIPLEAEFVESKHYLK